MHIKIYDFNKTIYDGNSTKDFYLYCLRKNPLILFFLPIQICGFFLYAVGIWTSSRFWENCLSFVKMLDDIDAIVEEFWHKNYFKVKKWYLDKEHKDDVIISASPEFLLLPICKKLGVKLLVASKVNKQTGKYVSQYCFGIERINRLYQEINEFIIDEFYSDSMEDLDLANIAKSAYFVNGDVINDWSNKKNGTLINTMAIFYSKDFIVFLLVGVINTANGIIFSHLLSIYFDANIAFILGYFLSLMVSFILNCMVTFKEKMTAIKFIKFCISYIPNFVIQNIVVIVFYNFLHYSSLTAYIIAATLGVPVTFFMVKMFAFRKK